MSSGSTKGASPSVNNYARLMGHIEDQLYRYRAKRIQFLINGDKFFAGINYALNTEKVRSFDALLNDLTRSLSTDHLRLCKGVRYIFALDGTQVQALTDFQDGQTYICSSTDAFITTDYRISNGMLNWLVRNSACISSSEKVRSKQSRVPITGSPAPQNQQFQRSSNRTPSNHLNTSQSHNNQGNNHNNNNINSQPNSSNSQKPSITKTLTPLRKQQLAQPKNHLDSSQNNISSSCDNNKEKPAQQNMSTPRKQISPPIKSTNSLNNHKSGSIPLQTKQQHNTPPIKSIGQPNNQSNLFGREVIEKYDVGRPIGDGHFSVVYCCMNKTTQEFCALKLIDKIKCRGRDDMIYNEVKILKRLNHPNIVKLIEKFDYTKQLYLILELVQDGDLFDAISTVTKFSETHVATMIYNLSSALTYLHNQGIVHRDIKPENLLISVQEDGSQSVKLADFGLAVEVSDSPLYSVCGTAFYVSPEMLNETGYSYKVDVWSTGVICFILLCGYPPFTSENESNQDELFDAILAGDFQFAPPYWSKISQNAKNLIKCMLTVDPEKRYTAEQVFKDPWTMGTSSNFEGINPNNLSRKIAHDYQ